MENLDFFIKSEIVEEMVSYCKESLPFEACGLLSSTKGTSTTLWKMNNETKKLNRFSMSSDSIKRAVQKMEFIGESLSGVFHSHPNSPAQPSTHDIRNNSYPELPYLIVAFYKGETEIKGFKVREGKVISLNIKIVD